jgi:hypothetical protein
LRSCVLAQPGITDFANSLTDARTDNIPTCGIFAVSIDAKKWSKFKEAKKNFLFFDYPRLLLSEPRLKLTRNTPRKIIMPASNFTEVNCSWKKITAISAANTGGYKCMNR